MHGSSRRWSSLEYKVKAPRRELKDETTAAPHPLLAWVVGRKGGRRFFVTMGVPLPHYMRPAPSGIKWPL
jgi:hypothetical protein